VKPPGLAGAKAAARAVLEGRMANGMSKAQRHETPFCCAHVAYETTCHVVSLVDPSKYFLATTGRCNGRWDGR